MLKALDFDIVNASNKYYTLSTLNLMHFIVTFLLFFWKEAKKNIKTMSSTLAEHRQEVKHTQKNRVKEQ